MDQVGASKATRRGKGQWLLFALLLAALLVGHDLLMTTPSTHAAPISSPRAHHQASTPVHEPDARTATHSWITHPHDSVLECPASGSQGYLPVSPSRLKAPLASDVISRSR